MSGWRYYTHVKPKRKRLTGEEGNLEYDQELQNCFNIFFEECKVNVDNIHNYIEKEGKYSLVIDTNPNYDQINSNSNYHVSFLKSKFLSNPRFKKALINYYNSQGVFVKGPRELLKNDQTKINKWVIDFHRHHSLQ